VPLHQPLQALLDPAVQVTDGLVVLGDGHQLIAVGQRLGLTDGREAFRVLQVHPLGAFQVDEVAQGPLAKPEQRDLHAWGVPARQDGEVRPVQVGRRPDRGEQVGGQGQMQHLLLGHLDDHGLPGGHLGQLLDAEPFLLGPLEGELREQVLTHQPVLQLTGLGEQPDKLLAVLDSQRRLDRQSRLLASGGLTPMLPRGFTGSIRPLASAAEHDLAFAACACWRTMLLPLLDTRSGGVTWPDD
jgi:hypothetical protein